MKPKNKNGGGNKIANAPRIAGQFSWYIKRQLYNFKNGVRGSHLNDITGMQMRTMALSINNDQDIEDVNKGMDMIDESLDKAKCKNKYMVEGNHDDWCNMAVERYPYIPQYKFANAVKLKERGYKYLKYL